MYIEQGYVEPGYFDGDTTGALYVDSGYVENGYFVGDETDVRKKVPIEFFINRSGTGVIAPGNGKVAVVFDVSNKVMSIIDATGKYDIESVNMEAVREIVSSMVKNIQNDTQFIQNIANNILSNLNFSIDVVAKDGTLLASPSVTSDGTTYTFEIPEALANGGVVVQIDVTPDIY